jgi:hypothetical protein
VREVDAPLNRPANCLRRVRRLQWFNVNSDTVMLARRFRDTATWLVTRSDVQCSLCLRRSSVILNWSQVPEMELNRL